MIRSVDLATGELRRSVRVGGDVLNAAALSPDGTKAAMSEGAAVHLYDLSTGRPSWSKTEFQPRPELPEINGTTTPGLVFSGDGRRLVSLTLDLRNGTRQRATARVWDSGTGRLVSQIVRDRYVDAPPVLLDGGRTLVLAETREAAPNQGRSETTAYLGCYETDTGRPLREHGSPECYTSALAAAPDGSWLATTAGNWVQVWDTASGTLAYSLGGMRYGKGVTQLAVSPDGMQIAAVELRHWGGHDGLVHVWRVADGRRVRELSANATGLAFAPDCRSLITCAADGTALVWDLNSPATAPPARRPLTDREIEVRWNALVHGRSADAAMMMDAALASTLWPRAAIGPSSSWRHACSIQSLRRRTRPRSRRFGARSLIATPNFACRPPRSSSNSAFPPSRTCPRPPRSRPQRRSWTTSDSCSELASAPGVKNRFTMSSGKSAPSAPAGCCIAWPIPSPTTPRTATASRKPPKPLPPSTGRG